MGEVSAWNGQFLGERVSLAVHADSATGTVITAAKSESADALVYPDQIGEFLIAHGSAELISYDAADDHWAMHGQLQRKQDEKGLQALWNFSRHSRFWDVGLLDQRLRLVRDCVYPRSKSLDQLVAAYGGGGLSSMDVERLKAPIQQGKMPAADDLAAHARAVMVVYQTLQAEAEQTARKHGIKNELVRKFGPLGTGIDVQAAIATGAASGAGLRINPDTISQIEQAAAAQYRNASETLAQDGHGRRVFAWNGKLVRQDEEGSPEADPKLLRKWLRHTFDDFRDQQNGLLRKRIAYELAANGYQIVAITDDEFILEATPKHDVMAVESVVVSAASTVLGNIAQHCCNCQVADAW